MYFLTSAPLGESLAGLNIAAANNYNVGRHYSAAVIRVIQREVGAPQTGQFDAPTAKQIYAWQGASARLVALTPDGKMGARSLGTLIAELSQQGKTADVALLTAFPHTLPPGFAAPAGSLAPILEFRAVTVTPLGLRAAGAGFNMGGSFRVIIRFNPALNCRSFEYRQFIRGTATLQRGTFATGSPPSLATWSPTAPACDASRCFEIPGGLPTTLREDGQIIGGTRATGSPPAGQCCQSLTGGRIERFGYRSSPPVHRTGLEDRYLPSQATGCEYRARDTYGLSGTSRPTGLRIRLRIVWQGRVIDTSRGNRIIATRHWGVRGDDIIT
jgi:hypothetical protein